MSVQKTVNMTKLEQVAIASALQLEGHLTLKVTSRSVLFFSNSVLHTCTKCYITGSGQNCDMDIRFSDPDFLKKSNNLAMRRR